MKTPSFKARASLIVGILVCLLFVGFGVTEEIPVGSVTGQVIMNENGQPLAGAFVTMTRLASLDDDDEDVLTEHHFRADKQGRFHLYDVVAGQYKVTVSAKAHRLAKLVVAVEEGKPLELNLEAAPIPHYFDLYASQRVFLPSESASLQFEGFTGLPPANSPPPTASASIYLLDYDKVIHEGGMYNALAPLARSDNGKVKNPATMGKQVQKLDTALSLDAEGTFADRFNLPELPEGLYWIEVTSGDVSKGTWISVSRIALVAKHTDRDVAAFVTHLDTGQPVPAATVGFVSGRGTTTATTDKDGLARLALPPKTDSNVAEVLVASYGQSRAIVDFQRASSGDDDEDSETRIYTYTDRPIYRPGDLVQFKGIVRRLVGSSYQLPSRNSVDIEIQDSSGTVIDKQTLPLSKMGSYFGSYQFSADALPDDYTIVTSYGSASSSKDFGIAAYRKPTFSIDVTSDKPRYIRGEPAQVTVQAKYYYGSPVAGAKVSLTVTRSPLWDWSQYDDSEEDFEEDYGDEGPDQPYPGQQLTSDTGDEVQNLTGVTDESGKAVYSVATMGTNESEEAENDYTYSVDAQVADQSNKEFDGEGSFTVERSDEQIRLDTDQSVITGGQPFKLKATILGPNGKPVQGVSVSTRSGFVFWKKDEEQLADVSNFNLKTGVDGAATFEFEPPGVGFYQINAQFVDHRRHKVSTMTEVYIWTSAPLTAQEEQSVPDVDLSVMLNKKRFNAGDMVRAVITCNQPGGVAMMAIEGAMIYHVQTVPLTSKANVVQFKVLNDYSPNAFVTLAYVKDKHFAQVSKRLNVDLGIKRLQVQVASNRKIYRPGDTAVYTVTTRNSAGQPVAAEVSLGVVDESIYAIFDDQSDIVKGFYPKRQDSVSTDYSFPELYLGGGDKAPTNIQVRRNFKDTAFWQPVADTNQAGTATVRVKLPDNLTSWRTTVRAFTADTKVGQSTCNVIAQKDLMVQLAAPAFVVQGDTERLLAMITNNTGQDADVNLNLTANDARVQGDMNSKVHVGTGAVQTVSFDVSPDHSGQMDFVAKAWIVGGASDGMELKVPARPHARLEADGYAGSTATTSSLPLTLQRGFDPYSGGLEISVAPSVATALLGCLNALVDYPYGCTEQTTSRFLPTVVFGKTYADLGLPKPKLFNRIPQIVQDSYARLKEMEHSDGAWGWWEYDWSDPYMTAYVLEALHRAEAAGYPVPKAIDTTKALDWACDFVKNPPLPVFYSDLSKDEAKIYAERLKSDTAYLIYSVALFGRTKEAKAALSKIDVKQADALQCAFYSLAANVLGEHDLLERAIQRMMSLATVTRSTVEWPEQDYYGYETTGRCFMALETIHPDDPAIPKIVSLLMQKRSGDMWFSTRDTSAILLAMADYLRHTKELISDADMTVSLNGKVLQEYRYAQGHFPSETVSIKLPVTALREGSNSLQFSAKTGVCYYTATLKQYVVAPTLPPIPLENTLTISRAYYKLQTERMEDGTLKLMPSHDPVDGYQPADVIRCSLKIHSSAHRDYVFIEVPTPSGLHVTDRETPDEGDQWAYWWSRTVILDDKVCFFAKDLPAGDSEIDYVLQAENPGTCAALPVSIYNMYDPHVYASSGDAQVEVAH